MIIIQTIHYVEEKDREDCKQLVRVYCNWSKRIHRLKSKNALKVDIEKSKIMVIRTSRKIRKSRPTYVNEVPTASSYVIYLGETLDSSLR